MLVPYRKDMIDGVIGQSSFGIWDFLNAGADTFGKATRDRWALEQVIQLLGRCGVPYISTHDIDVGLCPFETPDQAERANQLRYLKEILAENNVLVWMHTPCAFNHPAVRAGSFTANDVDIRKASLRKAIQALDDGEAMGASWLTLWLGRDGAEVDALIDARTAYLRIADAISMLCAYIRQRGYKIQISLEPKPNEPRGDIYVSTVGTALGIIGLLSEEDRQMVGVNPELLQHEGMAGLNAYHAIGQLAAADKLAFLHLGGQTPLRYDQDHPFCGGNSGLKESFYVMLGVVQYKPDCTLEFDCHPFRTEAGLEAREEFLWSNLEMAGIMKYKAETFLEIPAVQELIATSETRGFGTASDIAADPEGFFREIQAFVTSADTLAASVNPSAQELDRLVNLHLTGMLA